MLSNGKVFPFFFRLTKSSIRGPQLDCSHLSFLCVYGMMSNGTFMLLSSLDYFGPLTPPSCLFNPTTYSFKCNNVANFDKVGSRRFESEDWDGEQDAVKMARRQRVTMDGVESLLFALRRRTDWTFFFHFYPWSQSVHIIYNASCFAHSVALFSIHHVVALNVRPIHYLRLLFPSFCLQRSNSKRHKAILSSQVVFFFSFRKVLLRYHLKLGAGAAQTWHIICSKESPILNVISGSLAGRRSRGRPCLVAGCWSASSCFSRDKYCWANPD